MSDEERNEHIVLDLSRKHLKKVPKEEDAQNVRKLILDENELQRIDNIDSYLKIETLSLSKNQLLRMYGVCRLHCLRELNLSFNGILSIEGLKDCVHLRRLDLEGNNIKNIEHLSTNVNLEYLNLAENSLASISDISFLRNLKELYLHGNRLTHLRQCDKHLPNALQVLTLAKNNIVDLNEICTLSHLVNLHSLSINDNPCVMMTIGPNSVDGFDYRPFVLNWCPSLKTIDGFAVNDIESLKAEWLYSQGRGRQFRVGDQIALAKYLSTYCPLVGKALENENDRKLRLILSKAQQHQRQLQEEIVDNANSSTSTSPSSHRKKPASRIQSPRITRLTGRQGSPENMSNSYHGNILNESGNNSNHFAAMSTSLIDHMRSDMESFSLGSSCLSSSMSTKTYNSQESTPRNSTPNPYSEQTIITHIPTGGPLAAASKMLPVPETLMSPDVCPTSVVQRAAGSSVNTSISVTKHNKNKDNKLNASPRVRSPHLKHANSSPTASPRKQNNNALQQLNDSYRALRPSSNANSSQQHSSSDSSSVRSASTFISSSVHITHSMVVDAEAASSEEENEKINVEKLRTIRSKAAQKQQQQQQQQQEQAQDNNKTAPSISHDKAESAAVMLQKIWRGYITRKKTDVPERIKKERMQAYILQLTKDMAQTKAQLENERKIQQLQIQAMNALWKKVSTMEQCSALTAGKTSDNADNAAAIGCEAAEEAKPMCLDGNSALVVNDLAKNCINLTNQVARLQSTMRDVINCLSLVCNLPQEAIEKYISAVDEGATPVNSLVSTPVRNCIATQTDIVAVKTPTSAEQPLSELLNAKSRPSTLPLLTAQQSPAKLATKECVATQTPPPEDNTTDDVQVPKNS